MLAKIAWAVVWVLLANEAALAGTVNTTVPEPASMTLLATGMAALLIYRIRGRK